MNQDDRLSIQENLKLIRQRIQKACQRAGRNLEEVKLLLATKTVEPDRIKIAYSLGETIIGENKVQEALSKLSEIQSLPLERHFIGHLQSNKVKNILPFATMIQSVDRFSIAEEIEKQCNKLGKKVDVLIQINSSYEDTKSGVEPENAIQLIQQIAKLPSLKIKGLMTIGANIDEEEKVRESFRIIKKIEKEVLLLGIAGVSMDILSMGMSSDMEIAIEEGSTMVRVGSAIFGKRYYK